MAAGRIAVFLEGLKLVLEPAQLEEAQRSPLARNEDPSPLAKELMQKGYLTTFQINMLVRGLGRELVVGPYKLLDRLGEGGMGQVYRAYHKVLNRTVALKVIRKEKLANQVAVKRFFQEVRVVAGLNHPNIVTAFDAGSQGDTHYYAMELVDGTDLSKLVKEKGALPVQDAVEFVRQAALGLQHAHERGLVHRDIKPANLLLNKNDKSVKLLDLGLARITTPGEGPEDALTRVGAVIGTPDYLAPEQAVNSHAVDIRSDLYSLGCTFYFLLAGMPPFRATTLPEVLLKHQTETAAPLQTYRGDVPPALQAVVGKLIAKRPQDRYQTPSELVAALAPFARKAGPATPPPPPAAAKKPRATGAIIAPSRRDSRRKKSPAALVAAAAIVLVAGLAVGAVLYNPFAGVTRTKTEVAATQPVNTAPEPATTKAEDTPKEEPKLEPKEEPKLEPKVEPKEEPKVEPKDVTKIDPPKVDPPKTDPPKTDPPMVKPPEPKKEPAPDPFKVVEAEKLIKTTYADEFTKTKPAELAPFASKLYDEATKTKDDLVVRFAMFQLTKDLAAKAGEFGLVLRSIDALNETYAIDALKMKMQALQEASQVQQLPAYFRALTDATLEVVEEQVEVDHYPTAIKLLEIADAASRRANSALHLNRVQSRTKEVAEIAKAFETARSAAAKLQANGQDPDASLIWGRFQSFYKGNWGGGLVLLAQSPEGMLKDLAAMDLTNPEEADDQLKVGDTWWKLGESASGVSKKQLWIRAKHWYEQAMPKLAGFSKTRVETSLKEIDKLIPKEELSAEKPTTTVPGLLTPTKLAFDRQMSAGINAMRSGNYDKAVDAFNEALRLVPDDPKATQNLKTATYQMHMTRANYYYNLRRYTESVTEFEAALKAVPGDFRAEAGLKEARTRAFFRRFNRDN